VSQAFRACIVDTNQFAVGKLARDPRMMKTKAANANDAEFETQTVTPR
jgi:hypothetical protein